MKASPISKWPSSVDAHLRTLARAVARKSRVLLATRSWGASRSIIDITAPGVSLFWQWHFALQSI